MSDRQQLVEHGVGLCLWGIGLVSGATAVAGLVSVAAMGNIFLDRLRRCPRHLATRATRNIKAMLAERGEFSDTGIAVAAAILAEDRGAIEIDLDLLTSAEARRNYPDALYDQVFRHAPPPEEDGVADILRAVIREAFRELRKDDEYNKIFVQEGLNDLDEKIDALSDQLEGVKATLYEAVKVTVDEREELASLRSERQLLMALVKSYSPETGEDFMAAFLNIQSALATAAKRLELGTLPSNAGEAVDGLLAEIRGLNRAGNTMGAMERLRQSAERRKEERERQKAADARILEEAIAQAELIADAEAYAEFTLELASLDTDDPEALYTDMRTRLLARYEEGARSGVLFILLSAARLAHACLSIAPTPLAQAHSANDFGDILRVYGSRRAGPEAAEILRLSEDAFTLASNLFEEMDVAEDWAAAQSNLGAVALEQAFRAGGDERRAYFEKALAAFDACLAIVTCESVPKLWASAQLNRAAALHRLHDPEAEDGGTLEEAQRALDAAGETFQGLGEMGNYASALNNRAAISLERADDFEGDERRTHLEAALASYDEAASIRESEDNAHAWAQLQNNRGTVFRYLAGVADAEDSAKEMLGQSAEAHAAALSIYAPEDQPVGWAMAQKGLAIAKASLTDVWLNGPSKRLLEEALEHAEAALSVHDAEHMPGRHDDTRELRDMIVEALKALE
ncbi:MAG: hypothetical protein AAF618_02305 [Pseudomonadota bacterium]